MGQGVITREDIAVEDITKNIRDSYEKLINKIDETNTALNKNVEAFAKIATQANTKTKRGLDELTIATQQSKKAVDQANNSDKVKIDTSNKLQKVRLEEIRLEKAREKAIDDYTRKEEINAKKQAKAKQDVINASIKSKKATLDENNAYKQLTKQVNLAQARFKRLAVQHGINSKEAKKAERTFRSLDGQLRRVNNAANDGRRDVGRYGLALQGVKGSAMKLASALGLMGGAFAVFRGVQGAFGVLTQFDEKIADITKTTGLSKDAARGLSEELLKINTRTSIEGLQELASAAGRLGVSGSANILSFVEATDKAFVALGDDLGGTADEIATTLGKIASVFGDEARFGIGEAINKTGSAINSLAANSKASAPAILDFTQRMAGVASQAGIAQTDIQALGALFDSTGQSVEVAASTLNKLLPSLAENQEKFAKVAGMTAEEFGNLIKNNPVEAMKAVAVGAKSSEGGLEGLVATLGDFGVESARAAGIVGVLAGSTDELTKLQKISNDAFRDGTSLQEEFDAKNNTLSASLEKLSKEFQKYVLGLDEGGRVTSKLSGVLNFLIKNMSTILSTLGKVIKSFVVFKTVMLALKMRERYTEWAELGKGIKNADGSMREASASAKGFGQALKAIRITALIALVVELAKAWFNAASGAATYLKFQQAIENSKTKQGEFAQDRVDARDKAFNDEVNQIRLLRSEGKISAIEEEKRIKALTEARKRASENDVKATRARKTAAEAELAAAKKARQEFFSRFGGEQATRSAAATLNMSGAGAGSILTTELEKYDAAVRIAATSVEGLGTKISIYKDENEGLDLSIVELTISQNQNTLSTTDGTKAIEEKTTAVKELDESYKKLEESIRSLESDQTSAQIEDVSTGIEDELQRQIDLAIEKGNFEKDLFIKQIKDKYDLRVRASEDMRDFENMQAKRDIKDAQLLAVELERIEFEHQQRLLQANIDGRNERNEGIKQLEAAQMQYFESINAHEIEADKEKNDEILKNRKELFDALEELGNDELDKFIERSKRKQSILDDEINRSQELTDRLREGANSQNAVASESLAKQEEITNQKIKEKQDEADKEAKLEELKAAWAALNNFLEQGDSMASASVKAISGVSVFKSLVQSIQGFYSGTKGKLGDESTAIRGGKDGHLIWADSNEMIFNPDQVKAAENAGLNTTDSILQTAILNKQLSGATMMANVTMQPSAQSDQSLLLEIRQLRKSIESKEEVSFHPLMRNGLAIGIREQHRKGGIIENYDTLTRS